MRMANERMVLLPGGSFPLGTDEAAGHPADGERPAHRVRLKPFWLDRTTVSTADDPDRGGASLGRRGRGGIDVTRGEVLPHHRVEASR